MSEPTKKNVPPLPPARPVFTPKPAQRSVPTHPPKPVPSRSAPTQPPVPVRPAQPSAPRPSPISPPVRSGSAPTQPPTQVRAPSPAVLRPTPARVTLPLQGPPGSEEPVVTTVIVDDSEATRDMLSFLLRSSPIQLIGQAGSAQEAIELCTRTQPDLVFLDIVMPGMSGTEALVLIKQLVPDVTVVMLTSVSDRKTVVRSMEFGAQDYILKPFDRKELIETIRGLYERIMREKKP